MFKKNNVYKFVLLYASSIILMTCSGSDGGTSPTEPQEPTYIVNLVSLAGAAQKGPFNNGTIINIAELNNSLTPTGKNFTSQIVDNSGTFSVSNVQMEFSYAQINASGFYFDEVGNKVSSAQLVLSGLSNLAGKTSMNVNVLSNLEMNRIKNLTTGDNPLTFNQAKIQAQEEVLAIFGFTRAGMSESELLDITKSGSGNAKLLAISAILQSDRSVGQLSELLANISTDITEDGVLNDENIIEVLRQSAYGLDLSEIRSNLESRYASLGLSVTIPNFEDEVNNFYKPPVANDMNLSTDEDTAINITLDASDPEGESLTFTTVEVNNATVTINGNTATYSPNPNFNGTDTFSYLANDGSFNSNTATVTVTVGAVDDEPTTNDINTSTDEDVSIVMSLTADEFDGETYSFNIISNPSNGTVSLNGSQATYTPNQDWNGTDIFTFEATDDRTARTNVATATIVVNPVNDAPVANDVTVQMDENKEFNLFMPVTITLDATDIEGDNLAYSILSDPTNGTLGSVDGVQIIYTPNQDFNGQDTFTYKANDGTDDSNIATVTITIDAVNDTPVTTNQAASTDEDTAVDITLTSSDVEGDAVTYSIVNNSSNGTTSLSGDIVSYTPSANFNGTDTFTFKSNDGTADGNTSTVTITVNAINDAPVANDVTTETDENLYNSSQNNTNVNVTYDQDNDILIINDPKGTVAVNNSSSLDITLDGTDVDGDNLIYSIVSTNNGTVTVNGSSATYEPTQDWNGTDTFTYKANDGVLDSNIATVTITVNSVNDAPTSADEGIATNEDTPVRTGFSSSDIDGDALTYIVVSQPSNGTVTIDNLNNEPGLYTPNLNFNGTDTFTYKANDGELDSNIATATVTVTAVNDAPTTDDIATTIDENRFASRFTGITLLGSDVDGDNLTYTVVSGPSNGTASISGTTLTYEANQDYNGTETITYKANDGTVDSNTSTITITITPVNDTPVVTGGGTGQVDTQAIKFSGTGSYLEVPSNGTGSELEFSAAAWIKVTSQPSQPSGGTIIARRNYDGSERTHFHFWVGNNMNLSFMTNDRNVNTFQISTADNSITLNQWHYVAYTFDNGTSTFYIDGLPVSHSDSGSVSGNTNQLYSYDHWINIGAVHRSGGTSTFDFFTGEMNELTIWDDPLTQTDITTLYNDGKYYAADDLGKDLNGWWQFESSFLVDSSGTWGDASLIVGGGSVTTIDTNLSPSTTSASITTNEDTAGTIDLSSFASDVDGDALTYSVVTDVVNGTTSLSGSTVTYTPAANYNGTDSFTWSVTDGSLSASGTVDITVTAVNDAPTTDDIATTIDENRMASRSTGITLLGSDVDGDDLTYSIVSAPSNGTASISGATLTYEANQDYNGTETITYKANDGTVDSNTSTITITITPVNDTPVVTGTGSSSTNSYSMKFTGDSDSYLTIPTPATDFFGANDSFTIGMWFNQQSTNREEVLIHASSNGGTGFKYSPRVGIREPNQTIEYYISNNDELNGAGSGGTITIDYDTWYHLIFRVDASTSTINVFVDGVKDSGLTATYNPSNSNTPNNPLWQIGGWNPSSQSHNHAFDGRIDEVAIWDVALSDSDISTLYNSGDGSRSDEVQSSELLAYYDFESGSGTVVDQSGNSNDATQKSNAGFTTIVPFNPSSGSSTSIPTGGSIYVPNDYSTIGNALNAASSGQTIYVEGGVYNDISLTFDKNVKLISTDGAEATILNMSGKFDMRGNDETLTFDNMQIDGFTIQGRRGSGSNSPDGSVINVYSGQNVTIKNSIIRDNTNTSTWSYAPVYVAGAIKVYDTTFSDNYGYYGGVIFHANSNTGSEYYNSVFENNEGYHGAAIYGSGDGAYIVDNTIFYENSATGPTNAVIQGEGGPGNTYTNVTFVDNSAYAITRNPSSGSHTFEDIISWNNTGFNFETDTGSYDVSSSLIENGYATGTDIISSDPQFTDASNDDYTLSSGSPAATHSLSGSYIGAYDVASSGGTTSTSQIITTDEDTAGSIDLSSFASDVDGDDLTYFIVTDVDTANGTTALSGSTVTYTPAANYNGTDSFTWKVNDGTVDSATGTVNITITAVNDAPTTDDIATTIDENRTASRSTGITLLGSDVDGDDLTYSIVSAPSNGTASISGATLTYEANQDYNGTETITYKANDGTVDSNTSTITITITPVNDTPVVTGGGVDDTTTDNSFDGRSDGYGSFDINYSAFDVNTSNPGSASSPASQNGLANSSISVWVRFDGSVGGGYIWTDESRNGGENSNGTHQDHQLEYESGSLSYRYDGDYFAGGLEEIDISYSFNPDEWYHIMVVNEHGMQVRTGVSQPGGSTSENNGHRMYINGTFVGSARFAGSQMLNDTGILINSDAGPGGGGFDGYTDGFAIWDDWLTADEVAAITSLGRNYDLRSDSDSYASSDDLKAFYSFDSASSNVVSDLTGNGQNLTLNDSATVTGTTSTAQTITTNEDTAGTIDLSSFASDVDGDALTYSIVTDVDTTNGTTALSGSTVTYTPAANYNGTDSFTWSVTDGSLSASGTVDITVTAVNDAPTTDDIATTIDENRMASRSTGITLQGSDVDGDDLTYSIVTDASNGTASISGATLTYEANQDYNGTETITYKANDGTVDSNTSTITITITPVNDTPVVTGGTNSQKSLLFGDGGSSVLDLPEIDSDLGNPNTSWTWSTWFKPTHDSNRDVFIYAGESSAYNLRMSMTDGGTIPKVYLRNQTTDSANYQLSSSTDFADNRNWNHLAWVTNHATGQVHVYVNGVEEHVSSYDPDIDFNSGNRVWQIGGVTNNEFGSDYSFEGYMDDIAIWNTALTESQVLELYNDGNLLPANNIELSSLKAYYDFEDESLNDKSGNGKHVSQSNDVSFSSSTPSQMSGNLSLKFDASLVESGNTDDGYVQFPANTFDFGGEWTMSFWYKDGGVTTGTQRIFSRGYTETDPHEGSAGNAAIGIGFLNGGSFARNLEFHAREGSGEAAYSNSTITDSDGWQHYVIVRNNNSMDLYVNSSLDGFYNPIGNIVNNDYQTTDFINRIGSGALTLDDNGLITGWIDDFVIWDNSLNTSQISSLFNGGNGGVDPSTVLDEVVVYYSFDGETISGNTISDQSGNGHDATFTNALGSLTHSNDVPFGVAGGVSASSNLVSTDEDTALEIDLSSYASDVDGDDLTYTIVTDVSNGTTSLSGNTVTYTPTTNYNGTDSFTWKVNDGTVDSEVSEVEITINAVNDAPTTDDIATTIDENRMASRSTGITLQGSDVDGDDLTYSIVSDASNGTASISGATLTYEANQDYNGTETITYKANDGTADSNTSTITITITPVNDTPVVTGEDDDITYWNFTPTSTGDLVTISSGYDMTSNNSKMTISYDYALNQELPENTDIFMWGQTEGELNMRMGRGPSTNTAETTGNNSYYIQISIKDGGWTYLTSLIDYDTDKHNVTGVFDRENGELKLYYDYALVASTSYTTGSIASGDFYNDRLVWAYSSNWGSLDFNIYKTNIWHGTALTQSQIEDNGAGVDEIVTPSSQYNFDDADGSATINDSIGSKDGAVVSGTGGGEGTYTNTVTLNEDVATDIDLSSYVSDVDGDNLTYSIVTDVTNGTTSISGSTVTYTPTANYNGSDSFTFKSNDGTVDSATSGVSITVTAVNDAPTSSDETINLTYESDNTYSITLPAGSDIEGDDITYITVSTDDLHGSFSHDGSSQTGTFTSNSKLTGDGGTLTFKVNDGTSDSNISTVTLIVDSGDVTTNNTNTQSLDFSGNDTYVTLPEINLGLGAPDSAMSISFWVKDANDGGVMIQSNSGWISGNASQSVDFGRINTWNGEFAFGLRDKPNGIEIEPSATASVTLTDWNHIVYVFGSGENKMYINGVESAFDRASSYTSSHNFYNANRVWEIGRHRDSSDDTTFNNFTGLLDDLAIWDIELTSSQVTSLYNNGDMLTANNVSPDDLKAYYNMEGSGSTIVDQSGNYKDGTITNASFSTQTIAEELSMKFDASLVESGNTDDGYIQFPANTFNFGSEWTMSFWYKDGGVTSGTQRIFSRGYTETDPHEGSAGNAAIGIGFLNGGNQARNLEFHARESSGEAAYSNSTITDSDGWQHYVIVRNNNSMDLYINSSLDGFFNPIGNIVDNDYESTDFINRIGSGALTLDDNGLITGWIDDFAIWENSLNTTQISNLYNGGNGGVDPSTVLDEVVVYYNFNASTISGTTISDQSGNSHDATFTNVQGAITTSTDVP